MQDVIIIIPAEETSFMFCHFCGVRVKGSEGYLKHLKKWHGEANAGDVELRTEPCEREGLGGVSPPTGS